LLVVHLWCKEAVTQGGDKEETEDELKEGTALGEKGGLGSPPPG
jgi:hypothetical protein